MDALEKRLGLYYDLDGIIPESIRANVRGTTTKVPKVHSININSFLDNQAATGLRSLKNDAISYEQRERIAKSMLNGAPSNSTHQLNSDQLSAFGSESILSDEDFDDEEPVRDRLRPSNFLEISPNAAIVNALSPGKIHALKHQHLLDKKNEFQEVYNCPRSTLYSNDPATKSQRY